MCLIWEDVLSLPALSSEHAMNCSVIWSRTIYFWKGWVMSACNVDAEIQGYTLCVSHGHCPILSQTAAYCANSRREVLIVWFCIQYRQCDAICGNLRQFAAIFCNFRNFCNLIFGNLRQFAAICKNLRQFSQLLKFLHFRKSWKSVKMRKRMGNFMQFTLILGNFS